MIACVSASKDAIGFPCITTLHRASERPKMHTYIELVAEQQCASAQPLNRTRIPRTPMAHTAKPHMRICFDGASADVDWHVGHGILQGFVAAKRKQSFTNHVLNSAVQSRSPDMRTHSPCFAADHEARNQRGSEVVRLISPLNAQRVTSTRANKVPYDGSRILRSRTCVICGTCATSAARPRPVHNVRNGKSRPIYLSFERSTRHKHKSKRYAMRWFGHLVLKNMCHISNMRDIRCMPKASSQRP